MVVLRPAPRSATTRHRGRPRPAHRPAYATTSTAWTSKRPPATSRSTYSSPAAPTCCSPTTPSHHPPDLARHPLRGQQPRRPGPDRCVRRRQGHGRRGPDPPRLRRGHRHRTAQVRIPGRSISVVLDPVVSREAVTLAVTGELYIVRTPMCGVGGCEPARLSRSSTSSSSCSASAPRARSLVGQAGRSGAPAACRWRSAST